VKEKEYLADDSVPFFLSLHFGANEINMAFITLFMSKKVLVSRDREKKRKEKERKPISMKG
jgi:hypothetical protein